VNTARVATAVSLSLIVGWALVLRTIGTADVYSVLGPYASACVVVSLGLRRSLARTSQDKPDRQFWRHLGLGLGLGVAMTAATYLFYALAESLVPTLRGQVAQLYAAANVDRVSVAIAWTVVAIIAEELLFRGLFFEGLCSVGLSRGAAGVIVLVAYVLVQIGSGSGVIALAAFVFGSFWTLERVLTKSLTAPLVSHFIWTMVVIHLYPLVR